MLITEKAAEKVKEMASEQGFADHGLRVMVVGGGCSGLQYDMDFEDEGRPGDTVIDQHGLKLYVDGRSWVHLEGTKIDYVETFKASGFKFENPKATKSCGCGSSFAC